MGAGLKGEGEFGVQVVVSAGGVGGWAGGPANGLSGALSGAHRVARALHEVVVVADALLQRERELCGSAGGGGGGRRRVRDAAGRIRGS